MLNKLKIALLPKEDDVNVGDMLASIWPLAVAGIAFLIATIFWVHYSQRKLVAVFAVAVFIVALLVFLLYASGSQRAERVSRLFIGALVSMGVMFTFVFTPFTVPDEDYHFSASYCLANFLMGEGYQSEDPVTMREDDAQFFRSLSTTLSSGSYNRVVDSAGDFFCGSSKSVEVITGRSHSITGSMPQTKIASALGIVLARLLNLSSYWLFTLGRLFNFLSYVVLVVLAYRISPIGKNAIAVVSLLPMSLHLAASYSYDAFIISMSLLVTALCFRSIYSSVPFAKKECLELLVCVALLAPCKVIYVLLAFLTFFIPVRRFSSKKKSIQIKCGCALLVMALLVIIKLADILAVAGLSESSGSVLDSRGIETGVFYSLTDFIAAPFSFFNIIFNTIDLQGYYYIQTMVGGWLCWFQPEIVAPGFYVLAYVFILCLASLKSRDDEGVLATSLRVFGAGTFLLGVLLVICSMLLSWTFNTESFVQGVQGRYFLPFLPLLLLSLRGTFLECKCKMGGYLIASICVVNCFYLLRILAVSIML